MAQVYSQPSSGRRSTIAGRVAKISKLRAGPARTCIRKRAHPWIFGARRCRQAARRLERFYNQTDSLPQNTARRGVCGWPPSTDNFCARRSGWRSLAAPPPRAFRLRCGRACGAVSGRVVMFDREGQSGSGARRSFDHAAPPRKSPARSPRFIECALAKIFGQRGGGGGGGGAAGAKTRNEGGAIDAARARDPGGNVGKGVQCTIRSYGQLGGAPRRFRAVRAPENATSLKLGRIRSLAWTRERVASVCAGRGETPASCSRSGIARKRARRRGVSTRRSGAIGPVSSASSARAAGGQRRPPGVMLLGEPRPSQGPSGDAQALNSARCRSRVS